MTTRSLHRVLAFAALLMPLAESPGADTPLAPTPNYLPNDSLLWSQQGQAILLTDFSAAQPATALTSGRREKGKWKVLPFSTATPALQGSALSTYSFTGAPVISVPLKPTGWHAIYIGLSTVSTGFKESKNGLRARLSDEPVFKRMANNLALLPSRVDVIAEQFLTVADLHGQSLELGSLPRLPATVCYIKLIPLTKSEVDQHTARSKPNPKTRTAIATFDGHSWIWPYEPQSEADLLANFRGYENSDVGKWWFQVLGADLVCYPSKIGTLPGAGTEDFSTEAHATFVRTVKGVIDKGLNPLKIAREEARRQGVEFHILLRPAGWKAAIPFEETFDSAFYEAHAEWRCIDRDGTPTMHMSYAYPEVRQHLLEIYRETLELQPDGVGLLFNRGMPMLLWEDAFCQRFQKLYPGIDAKTIPEDDPRILSTRAAIMTDFLTEIRTLLDDTAKKQGRTTPYKISLGTFAKEEDNQKFGFDLPNWIAKGLVNDLGVAWFAHHTSFAQPDMAYYKRITTGTNVGLYPFIISWKSGKPQELCKKVVGFYQAGATGIAIWDPTVESGWTERPHGNLFETLSRIGDRSLMVKWAKQGVPLPLSIPLTRLDENYYSRWFPTTGF